MEARIMSETRNLIINFDGTWNDSENMDGHVKAPTNVYKFDQAVQGFGDRQISYYEDGVGSRPMEALPGGIYGYGLDKRLTGAYRWLSKVFNDTDWQREQNKIIITGFSRGAYTARKFADFVDFCGLPVDPNDDEKAYKIYNEQDPTKVQALIDAGEFFKVKIEMVGVWDTVKMSSDPDFTNGKLSKSVKAGYHALAIDEERIFFPDLKWENDERVLQKWFAGVHSDVGGGYKENDLSDGTFLWMAKQALKHGISFDADFMQNINPNPEGTLHNSRKGIWETTPKRIRKIDDADLIDESVKTRLRLPEYKPENLPEEPIFSKV